MLFLPVVQKGSRCLWVSKGPERYIGVPRNCLHTRLRRLALSRIAKSLAMDLTAPPRKISSMGKNSVYSQQAALIHLSNEDDRC